MPSDTDLRQPAIVFTTLAQLSYYEASGRFQDFMINSLRELRKQGVVK